MSSLKYIYFKIIPINYQLWTLIIGRELLFMKKKNRNRYFTKKNMIESNT